LPDAQSLIRHSGAAAPLLDAIKARSAGSAVRSVIDKLLAGPAAPSAAAAPPPKNPD
jgi:AsmA protein